jgi:DNA polymerase-3 subunit gamma/tau
VPDAAEVGLLDLPSDRAERMAAQAGRLGQAGLTRAAEIVSTGLDQMRGATSPRLLLELMCAQVLLPAATTDEKSLLARLERLESGSQATGPAPAPAPQSPPRPPHTTAHDEAERSRPPAAAKRNSPEPAETAPPAVSSAAPVSRPVAPAEPPAPPAPVSAATAGSSAVALRQNWPAVLEAIKRERRVAWILLSNASVLSLEDNVLTLGFARDGDLKGFSTSGCDADLRRVLGAQFGLNVMVKGVTGGDAGGSAAGRTPGDPDESAPPKDPAESRSARGSLDPDSAASAPAGSAGPDPARATARAGGPPAGARPAAPRHRDEPPPDEMPPDEADEGPPPGPELTGMDLIQRELGGQVISEIEG